MWVEAVKEGGMEGGPRGTGSPRLSQVCSSRTMSEEEMRWCCERAVGAEVKVEDAVERKSSLWWLP